MRVALVHDWLFHMRGGEKCLAAIAEMFSEPDIYCLFYRPGKIAPEIASKKIISSSLNRLPFVEKYYRYLLPLYPRAIKNLESKLAAAHAENPYDLVISISHCAAKNIKVPAGIFHLCYCLTPMRYIWDQYNNYFGRKFYEPLLRPIISRLRTWDVRAAAGVNQFVAISSFVKERIDTYYGAGAKVIYPPVDTSWIETKRPDKKSIAAQSPNAPFICVNALVPYKNVHIVVEAFNELKLPLVIVGEGPEKKFLKKMSGNTIKFIDYLSELELAKLYASARALVFAAEEDFGMIPVEAQAAGTPVICLRKGGVLETVNCDNKNPTGIFFNELSKPAIVWAVKEFIQRENEFKIEDCVSNSQNYSPEKFEGEFLQLRSLLMVNEHRRNVPFGQDRPKAEFPKTGK